MPAVRGRMRKQKTEPGKAYPEVWYSSSVVTSQSSIALSPEPDASIDR